MNTDKNPTGLSSAEVENLRGHYGLNVMEEKKRSLFSRIVGWVVTPMSAMFVAAGGLSIWSGQVGDAVIIAALFLTNVGVGAWHEAKADNTIEKLKEKLAVMVKVLRDGTWSNIPSAELVPGDVIELSIGSLIPADISFTTARNVSVNESVVTGESMPKEKQAGDSGYSGTFLSTGLANAKVTATGSKTYFGKAMVLVENVRPKSHLEKDILSISRFLSIISIVIMAGLTAVLWASHLSLVEIATLDVSMLIAGIPVALPTVMTLIISVGVMELAKKSVIVRRLSSLEDLANVNLILSDKTGTLTENKIAVSKVVLLSNDLRKSYVWPLALAASPRPKSNPLDIAIESKARELGFKSEPVVDFIPGDSDRKRTTAFILVDGIKRAVSFGAPQTIRDLCEMDSALATKYDTEVSAAAKEGFRVLALAESKNETEEEMRPLALFFLADAIRADAKDTIGFMNDYGIDVKMVTGDGYDVAKHVANELGLKGEIVRRQELENGRKLEAENRSREEALAQNVSTNATQGERRLFLHERSDMRKSTSVAVGGADLDLARKFPSIAGFAEVLPKDKYDIVLLARAARKQYIVAATGDGVNDVPPIKAADVGFAVSNAVDALKAAADIVLVLPGIAVIKDAVIEARKIFVRLYNYSLYRISESFRLIVTIAVIGIIFHTYPLTPVQIILIALLNDIPIISLAYDKVTVSHAPSLINSRKRFTLSIIFGFTGIANSMILLWIAVAYFHAPWAIIQTLFFLKLTVSGHMLVYVAHTERPWYKFLPSHQVIIATIATQIIASCITFAGFFTAPISMGLIALVWIWSFGWMQVAELSKQMYAKFSSITKTG